jgi:hypothetical protein
MRKTTPVFCFFVDANRHETERNALSGAEIKARAKVPAAHQLVLIGENDFADRLIADEENIYVEGHVKNFYTIPSARKK